MFVWRKTLTGVLLYLSVFVSRTKYCFPSTDKNVGKTNISGGGGACGTEDRPDCKTDSSLEMKMDVLNLFLESLRNKPITKDRK